MTAPAERMRMMRQRRRARGLRELRLVVADPRSRAVRRRVARQVAGLDPDRERDALRWIESVSEFDAVIVGSARPRSCFRSRWIS
jgi:Protein  of unknown function (DUF3018)